MDNICRTCLRSPETLLPMVEDEQLPYKIEIISSVQVLADDNLPTRICPECILNINISYNFRKLIINSDSKLRSRCINKRDAEPVEVNSVNVEQNSPLSTEEITIKQEPETVEDASIFSEESEKDTQDTLNDNIKNSRSHDTSVGPESRIYYLNLKKKGYKCRQCDFVHFDYTKFRKHRHNYARKAARCDVCSKTMTADYLVKHMYYSHPTVLTNKVGAPKEGSANTVSDHTRVKQTHHIYKCSKCNFGCSESIQWAQHKLSHVPTVTKSICNICGKAIRSDNLKKHVLSHTEAPVSCKICSKTCKNSESLRGHMFIHKRVKRQCSICGKIYGNRAGYAEHMKRHASGDVKTVECSLCSKRFYDQKTLKKHIRSHTGERPYPCQYCQKGFSSSYALKTHVRQHTNEKPYVCEICSAGFHQKVSLKTHLKSKHSIESTT